MHNHQEYTFALRCSYLQEVNEYDANSGRVGLLIVYEKFLLAMDFGCFCGV